MRTQPSIQCSNCRRLYPDTGVPFRCLECGGVYNYSSGLIYDQEKIEPGLPGIYPYRHTFSLPHEAPVISLGEGKTPLEWREIAGRQIAFKLEYQNPTGSFKDRGAAVLLSFLRSRGVGSAVEDSSGNAGAAFAAYALEAGLEARVFIPESASAAKRLQIEKFGAQVICIKGPRSNSSEAVLKEAEKGSIYASHAYLPHLLSGYATAAYEIVEQLGEAPGAIVSPVGQGNLLIGMLLGFQSLLRSGITNHVPVPVGVQSLACAPIWAVKRYGISALGWVTESPTVAEGVRVRFPVRGDMMLNMLDGFSGEMIAVDEKDILAGRDQLRNLGFSVEPTSAIVWQALQEMAGRLPGPIVVMLTGAGFKSP